MIPAFAIPTVNPEHDYRMAMQQAGVAYLKRHRGEHLAGDSKPLENLQSYLVQSLQVPRFMAGRIAELAITQFEDPEPVVILDFDLAIGPDKTVAWLIDRGNQARYPIAARFLPTHLQHRFTAQH